MLLPGCTRFLQSTLLCSTDTLWVSSLPHTFGPAIACLHSSKCLCIVFQPEYTGPAPLHRESLQLSAAKCTNLAAPCLSLLSCHSNHESTLNPKDFCSLNLLRNWATCHFCLPLTFPYLNKCLNIFSECPHPQFISFPNVP